MYDVVAAHGCVLDVGTGFSVEIERFFEVEGDDRRAGELQEEIPQSADCDLPRDRFCLRRHQFRVAFDDFAPGLRFQDIQQIVGFDSLTFSAGHFNVRPFPVFRRHFNCQLLSARWSQRDDLI